MKYDIFSSVAPAMPRPAKGTEVVKVINSKASHDMREPIVPMSFSPLSAHLKNVEFMYADNTFREMSGQMDHLVAPQGTGKQQFTKFAEMASRSSLEHDSQDIDRLREWATMTKTKGANSQKPPRPEVYLLCPPSDTTHPAFIQNAMALEKAGNLTQYINLPEVEMADRLCGGHKQVSEMVRLIHDNARGGQLRATAEGVTGNPKLHVNLSISSTVDAARLYYKRDLTNGFFGRIAFAYKPRGERKGKIPRQGQYDEEYLAKLDAYVEKLENCQGRFVVKPLNKIADQLAMEMAQIADLADDDLLFEVSHRSIFNAWKKGAVLWILNDQTWTHSIGEFVIWFCYYDLWSKVQVFGDMFIKGTSVIDDAQKGGPKNMLDSLPDTFNEAQLEALRQQLSKSVGGTKHQLNVWKNRKFVTYSAQTGLYSKTEEYLGK